MKKIATTLLWTVIASAANAQSYTLESLVDTTLVRNPAIRIAEEGVVQKQLALEKEVISHNPASVTWSGSASETVPDLLGGTTTASSRPVGAGSTTLTLSKTLYQYKGGSLSASERKAQHNLTKAELALERKRQLLRKQVQHAYFDLLKAKADQQEDQAVLERLHEHARISEIFYEQGTVWKNDVLQSAVKIAQGEKKLIASRNSVKKAEATLNQLMDRRIQDPLEVVGELGYPRLTWGWEEIEQQLEQRMHPDLQMAILDQEIASVDVAIKKAAQSPELSLTSSYTQDYDFTNGKPSSEDLALSLSLSWDLWDSGSTGKDLATSRSAHVKSGIQLHEKEQAIQLAVRNSWYSLQEAEDQVEVLQQALENAKENYRVNQVRYQEQLGSANDLLSAQDMLSSSRKDWLSALAQFNKARYSMQYELGIDDIDL